MSETVNKPKLSPRLKMAADMVRQGAVAADIGTDHAYLSSYLIASGRCPRAIASDLRTGPLQNAHASLVQYGLTDKVELRQSDGLDAFSPDDADDFVFAGMGGTLISQLIERVPWIKNSSKRLIFQPMTHAELVRAFLVANSFTIIEENACFDECRPYIALCAYYNPSDLCSRNDAYIWLGELTRCKNAAASYYFTKQYLYLKTRADALEKANLLPDEVSLIRKILPELAQYAKKIR